MNHLIPAAKAALDLSSDERISVVKSARWVGYPRAGEVLRKLDGLYSLPKTARMPNVLLVGPTNNGKTSIINRFEHLHQSSDNSSGEQVSIPVLVIQAPPVPDETSLYDNILIKFATPIRPNDHARNKRYQVLHLLRQVATKVLIIDEIQHLLAGDTRKQHSLLNVIKYLGNELQIPIIAAGVPTALNAIQIDAQVANRFQVLGLPRWSMNDDFRRLLASFEALLPLKQASNLAQRDLAEKILMMSEGTIGEVATILNEAAVWAISTGAERISAAALNQIEWIAPSDRRRKAESVIE